MLQVHRECGSLLHVLSQQPEKNRQLISKKKWARGSIKIHYLEDLLQLKQMKCFSPVMILHCVRTEIQKYKNKFNSDLFPILHSDRFRKKPFIIEIAFVINEMVVINSLRTMEETKSSYSIQEDFFEVPERPMTMPCMESRRSLLNGFRTVKF